MTLRVAIVGGGPAGIYAADQLVKSEVDVSVDILERLPAPFGLVRYGVAPDHPRIKEIIKALQRVLVHPDVRLLGNVDLGDDIKLEELREFYDAVIVATGATADRDLDIPGEDLPGSYGAADFVSWYDAHPDVPRTWPLEAEHVAVLGVGNVALDVARVLAKTGDEMLTTDIPAHVHEGLMAKRATDVHVFARRGPAYAKFSPLELRELAHSPNVEVIVHPEGFEVDDASMEHIGRNKQAKMVLDTLANWVGREPAGKPHRIHLHFLEQPVEVLGERRRRPALRTERTRLVGDGSVEGTGQVTDWDVQAVYRAVGYRSSSVVGLPVRRPRRRRPQRRRPGPRPGRRADPGHLRHRLDQARPDRPDRPHQERRGRDGRAPGRRDHADRDLAYTARRSTPSSSSAASTWPTSTTGCASTSTRSTSARPPAGLGSRSPAGTRCSPRGG